MVDKAAVKRKRSTKGWTPLGEAYCDKPGTSCWYDENDVCISCGREKGWRLRKKLNRQRVYYEDQVRVAFWRMFHKSGDFWFDYLGTKEENESSTHLRWLDFLEELRDDRKSSTIERKDDD